ncbi:MAG: outer membrane protein transport protein [Sphingomonadales bacterium]|nr:outer membrane protein transport protein [Sphingomonadales bacterium]MDE2568472.1 outer membrane protein transport protein [Sphingomonadales bacterium]
MVRFNKGAWLLATSAAMILAPGAAHATDGYFLNGISIVDKGHAGAGVANPETPLTIGVNPAGIAEIDPQVDVGITMFTPRRQFTGSGGPGFTPTGTVKSTSNYFFLPSAGATWKIGDNTAVGVAVFGNGGMNTHYDNVTNPACASPPLPSSNGVYCGGNAGVNLIQAFVSAGVARKLGDHLTVGVAPVFGMQIFHAQGLAAFSGLSVDPTKMTNNGNSTSTGFGVRLGALLKLTPDIKLGFSWQSKMKMSRFKEYSGLFADGGKFDIPSSFTVGLSMRPVPMVTFMADYRHIEYQGVASVARSSLTPAPFGSAGGPGFGWTNVDEYKFGLSVTPTEKLTLRAGMSFNNNPVQSQDATLNILAPGVSKEHFTGGVGYKTSERSAVNFAFVYSPDATTTGIEITPAGPNPGHAIELKMHQFEVGLGWSHKF